MSDKTHRPEDDVPLPDPDLVTQAVERATEKIQANRGYYTAVAIVVLAAIVAVFYWLNRDPVAKPSEFAMLWSHVRKVEERFLRDLSAREQLGELDRYVESVRGTPVEGNALWLAAILHYREAETADKETFEQRALDLDKTIAHLKELQSERFDDADLLIEKPKWFSNDSLPLVDQLLAQAESDRKWWQAHGYKEPTPAADRVVVLRTELGDVYLQFFSELAPLHAEQFIKLCQLGAYNGTLFHFVRGGNAAPVAVGAGDPYTFFYNDPLKKDHILRWGRGGVGNDLPPEEARFRVNHQKAIVTSHRPDQADWDNGIQFEILVDTDRDLDRVNTPFAKVVEGMSVISAIAKRKTASDHEPYQEGLDFSTATTRDLLVEPVVIQKAIVFESGKALEHKFELAAGEQTLAGLKDAPVQPLPADQIYGDRRLRSPKTEGAVRFGLDYPFPADVDDQEASEKGERS